MSRPTRPHDHTDEGGPPAAPTWWEYDAQGIPLALVCEHCAKRQLSRFRPEILRGYTQADVDEPIEPEPTLFPTVES